MLKSTLASICVDDISMPCWWVQGCAVYANPDLLLQFSNDRLKRRFARLDTPAGKFPRLPERRISKVTRVEQQQAPSTVQNGSSYGISLNHQIRYHFAVPAIYA